jgi:low temperature requirement protein LtrA
MATTVRQRVRAVAEDASVTPLELFFDLVFVYALTQVTAMMSDDPTWRGVLNGVIVLALFWWCWVGYSWLGSVAQSDEGWTRAGFMLVMATMFVAALAIPEAFDDLSGGLDAPLVLALCYAVARIVHLVIFWEAGRADPGLLHQLVRFGGVMALSIALAIGGALAGGDWQLRLWLGAVLVDYVGTQVIGASGWRLHSAPHFAERHGLIIIVALGESIVALGLGVSTLPVSSPIVVASVVGIALAGAFWWLYFDVVALVAEQVLTRARGEHRSRIARDAYSYIHLGMVAGIVFTAFGLKKVMSYVGGADGHDWTDAIHGIPLYALHGGVALYLLSHVAFRLRNVHTLSRQRLLVAALLVALIPVGDRIGALADLVLVTAVMIALVAYEAIRFAGRREEVRHALERHEGAAAVAAGE